MTHRRPILPIIPILLLLFGCAHKYETKPTKLSHGIKTLQATAIVEFTKNTTRRGRAFIRTTGPESFRIEIKGPLNSTAAVFIGNGEVLTSIANGLKTTFGPDDARLPFKIQSSELVSLLLGAANLPPHEAGGYETVILPNGKNITRRRDGKLLYHAALRDYRAVSGFNLPFKISIVGENYKLLIKYKKVVINAETEDSGIKTRR